jgi:hypothetical protein
MKTNLTFGFVLLLASTALAQQTPTGLIQGTVIQAGAPDVLITGAKIELRREGSTGPFLTTTTDGDGRFFFPNLGAGQYRIAAIAGGYVRGEFGQKRTNGPGLPLTLAPNQQLNNVAIAMVPTGSISGRVTSPTGEPVALADVFALRASYQEGQRLLTIAYSAKTDDRGEYRMFWLTPGQYYVDVVVPDGTNVSNLIMNPDNLDTQGTLNNNRNVLRDVLSRPIGTGAGPNEAHVPVYYPTTTEPQLARAIDLRSGADLRGIDITAVRVLTRNVRGIVFNGVTRQPPGVGATPQAVLAPLNPAQQAAQAQVDQATGKFEFTRVVPGQYILYTRMRAAAGNTPTIDFLWGSMPLEIRDRDINDITLAAVPGIPLPGRVVIEDKSGTAPPSVAGLFIGMRPDPLITQTVPSPSTTVSAEGTFTLPPILAGKYRVYVIPMLYPNNPQLLSGLPPMPAELQGRNPYVKSIRVGSQEVVDTGINLISPTEGMNVEIVLGTNPGALEGRVLNDQKQPIDGAIVGLIPAATTARGFRTDMYKTALSDSTGRFAVANLPPGEYKVFSWEDVDRNALIDADFMRQYETLGTVIRVNEGERSAGS